MSEPEVRPILIGDLFEALLAAPMGFPAYTDQGQAVIGFDPFDSKGPSIRVEPVKGKWEAALNTIRGLVDDATPTAEDGTNLDLDSPWPDGDKWRKLLCDISSALDDADFE